LSDLLTARFARADPDHGGMTAYKVWTAGGYHHGEVEQFPTQHGSYWRAWRHPPSGRIPVRCQACGAPRRFPRRRDAVAALLGHKDAFQTERAALVLATAALRLLTRCDHGEQQPGTCADCEPLPPLVQVTLDALPRLCPDLSHLSATTLGAALGLVETSTAAERDRDLSQLAGALRRVGAGVALCGGGTGPDG
jgi:hypothetical protein